METKKLKFIGILFLLIIIVSACTDKYENPKCQTDADCKSLSSNAQCVAGTCQLVKVNENNLQPPALPEE